MMSRVRRIVPRSAAVTLAVLYGCLGLLCAPFFYLISRAAPMPAAAPFPGMGFGLGFAFAIPVLYALLGLVFGYVGALLYNWVASLTGGFEFELDASSGNAA